MLDKNDVQILCRTFKANEHEFRQDFVYITESAITNRIEEVDPSWVFEIVSAYIRDNQSIVNARLTIKGVSRDGVGMQVIMDKGTAEPEKGAATDALKRCARLFGIGRYLLDTPSGVKDMTSLTKWLNASKSNEKGSNSIETTLQRENMTTAPQIEFLATSAKAGKDTEGNYLELIAADGTNAFTREKDVLKNAGYEGLIKEFDIQYPLSPFARVIATPGKGGAVANQVQRAS